jgi:twinfilin-like protein
MLTLNFSKHLIDPTSIAGHLPTDYPSFTFYKHPTTHLLYFIFHSPDTAIVQQRMKHTMAIPGLIVHAEDAGVHVDQKIEIHDPDDLVFEDKDEKIGKFRSMYLRNGFKGTELMYEGSERDKKFLDSVV